jgi:UDP-N-acetylglucosamine 2-epimerase (non-hydrolysing)
MVVNKIKSDRDLQNDIKDTLLQSGLPERMVHAFFQPPTSNRRLVLITGHRRENFGDGFLHICQAIKTLAEKYPDVDFVYPMHLNPNVRKPIKEIFGDWVSNRQSSNSNLYFIEPLEYLPFVFLMEQSTLVLTDSGGIQEEAPGLGKPVLVMRNTTERPEAVEAGTVKLVGTDYDLIVSEVSKLLDNPTYYNAMAQATNPYGDGLASKRIIEFLK